MVNAAEIPVIWELGDTVRVLNPDMTAGDRTLLVLAHHVVAMTVSDLQEAVEYRNVTEYKRKVLQRLHDKKLIEYSRAEARATISPLGLRRARELHASQ